MKLKRLFSRKKNHRREPRPNAFVLESLEPRLLLSATPMTAAVVTTDHVDYAPGETAVITTANTNGDGLQFGAGEFVRFQVTRTDGMADAVGTTADVGPTGNEAWYVADGVGGFSAHLGSDVSGDGVADWIAPDNDRTVNSSISTTWFVEEQYRNSSLLVTAVGQESGAVASQAFTDAAENTTTTVTSSSGPSVVIPGAFESTYGEAVTFTATVTAAVGANGSPTGTVEFYSGGTLLGTDTTASIVSPTQSSFSLTLDTLSASNFLAGIHAQISAKYISNNTGDTGWNDSTSGTIVQVVNQLGITGWITAADKVYDGTTAATETGSRGLNGVLARDEGNVILTNGTDPNLAPDGLPLGGPPRFSSANVDINVSVFLWHAILTGTAASNYRLTDANIRTEADITKANATVTVSGYTGVYDGLAHGATGTATGVLGADLSGNLNLGATFTDAPGGIANWTFTGGTNYHDQSGSVAIVINAVVAVATTTTVSSSAATSTYGDTVTFTATVTAGSGTDAPTGTVAFFAGTTLLGTDSVTDSSGVGTSTWSFTTASLTAGAHAIHAVYTATGNFTGSQSAAITQTVNQKSLIGNFTVANKVYDGTTAAGVGTRTLVGVLAGDVGNVSLTGGTATFDTANAGTGKTVTLTGATLTGTAAGNYSLLSVATTTANITALGITGNFTAANKVYDGTRAASVLTRTLAGVLAADVGNVSLTGGTATFSNANVRVNKTVTLTGATLTGAAASNYSLLSVATTTANITALGITGNFTAANKVYDGTTVASVLTRTLAGVLAADVGNVSLTGGTATFDTANAGTGKTVTLTGATLGGTAARNYSLLSVATTTADIAKANATFHLTGYLVTYDGQVHTATGTVTGVNGEDLSAGLDLSSTTHVNAGLYRDIVTFTDGTGNYKNGYKAVRNDITQAHATISVTGYLVTYDGAAHQATGTVTGVNGEDLSAGLDLSSTTHVNAGLYRDIVTFTDGTGNYKNGYKAVRNDITQAHATISVTGYLVTYDGAAHQATGTVTGVNGEDLSAGLDLSSTTHVNAGLYRDIVTFTDGTGNYKNGYKAVRNDITQAHATISVTGYLVTYDGQAHTATGTVTGVNGEDLSAGLDLSSTTHVNAGLYRDIVTFTDGTGNYKNGYKAVRNDITQAHATISVTGYLVTFDGQPHTATGTVTGVNGEDLSAGLDLSSTTHVNAGLYRDIVTFTDGTGNYKNGYKAVRNDIV